MAYNEDIGWDPWATYGEAGCESLYQAISDMKKRYDRWQSFRAGRSDADIAAAFGDLGRVTQEADVAAMDAMFAVGADAWNFLNNVAVATSDRWFSMRKFMRPPA